PYPASSTAAMISVGDAVPSTPMELVSRLTEQDVTPGTLDTAFSTRALHAAQLIPVTLYCSISLPPVLLHQLLQGRHQLVDRLFLSAAYIVCHAGTDVVCQQHLVKAVQGRIHRRDLDKDIRTVGVILHHLPDTAHLSFDPAQTVEQILVFFLRALLCLVRTPGTGLFHFFHVIHLSPIYMNPLGVFLFTVRLRSEEHTSELQSRFDLVCRL